MTLVAQISSLATRTGQEFKTVRAELSTGLSGKSNTEHTHVIGDVTSLQAALDAKLALAGGTLTDGASIVVGAITGTKIGTATTQKLGFFNATPIVQPAATTDLGTVLSGLGLRAAGTAYPITTSGAVSLTSASNVIVSARTSKAIPAILTAATTLTNTSSEIQNADATTAPFNITLPTASLTVGQHFTIKKIDASANAVTIVGTIDGVANTVLSRQNEAVTLVATTATGTWRVINRLQSVTTLIGTTATGQSLMTAADAAVVRAISGAVATDDPRLSDARTPTAHTHPATGISDSTATGRAVLTATDATAARIAIGAGTSSLALGTTSSTAKAGDYVPAWAEITSKPATFPPTIGSTATTAVAGNDPRLTDARTPTAHTHVIGDVTGLQTALDGKVATSALTNRVYGTDGAGEQQAFQWSIDPVAYTMPARRDNGQVGTGTATNNDDAVPLSQMNTALAGKSNTGHTHLWADITDKPTTFAPTAHTHTASQISDSTATGRSVLTATDATAARTAIGAGTSSLALGTTSTTAKAGDYQPTWAQVTSKPTAFAPIIGSGAADAVAGNDPRLTDARTPTTHTHTASQISDSTAVGRSLVTAADAAVARTAIGAVQKPATQVSGSGIPWASEMIINSGALANGYNDGDGGVLVDKQIILRQVCWRIAAHNVNIGGSGNMQIDWYQATPTTEPGTLIATTQVAAGQHDVVVTLVTPYTVPINTVLRAKFTMGSTTVASKSHIQWRGDIDVN